MAKRENKGCLLSLPDELMSKTGTSVSWKSNNSLLLYGSCKIDSKEAKMLGPCNNTMLHEIQWNQTLHNPVTRKFVNEAHGIFVALQKKTQDKDEMNINIKKEMVSASHVYRSILSACIFNLQKASTSSEDNASKEDFLAQSELFYTIELVWHLCEILYIDVQATGLVLNQLLEWIQWHSNEGEDKANQALEFETPYNQTSYWEAIYCFLLQGKLENARTLLKIHNCAERDDFVSMDELIRKMPLYQTHNKSSQQPVGEFSLKWRFWQDECIRRLQDGEYSSLASLEKICKILCGDKQTFLDLSYLCGTWYNLMVSELLYTNPCVKAHNLSKIAKECMEAFGGTNSLQESDKVLLAVMDFDLSKLLHELCLFPDSWWFAAHLTDLLQMGGQLEAHNLCHSARLREFIVSNFASCLMDHSSLWQVGIDYLDTCPEFGRHLIEIYLERIPLRTTEKAWKLLAMAEKREMTSLVNSICKTMSIQSLRNEQIGSALMWAVQAKDAVLATHIADKFLNEYSENGSFSDLDLLDNLGSCMLVSDRLTFLGKYREFHQLYGEKEFRLAADLLISLLASNLAPKNFWLTLLLDAIPLLEAEELIFSSQQTYQLLYCLEEFLGNHWQSKTDLIEKQSGSQEKVALLRLSISRNLARAFIEEGSKQ